ncbi:hypothetical protein KIN20_011558 [Parelaphostrongylus tenuis]|uniref:GATA-type domain-containing protein n=1 Tax=Parelaphostrongylus tenuis TaxID=148309 RepID=A0AAD5MS87_PARTN|nr:hypothetical protein KIN20_011558 [Parelaphostrongylus tenuis]
MYVLVKEEQNEEIAATVREGSEMKCTNCQTKRTPQWRIINGRRVCNTCGTYYQKYRRDRPIECIGEQSKKRNEEKICTHCCKEFLRAPPGGWRRLDGRRLCNACFSYYKRTGKHRPMEVLGSRRRRTKGEEICANCGLSSVHRIPDGWQRLDGGRVLQVIKLLQQMTGNIPRRLRQRLPEEQNQQSPNKVDMEAHESEQEEKEIFGVGGAVLSRDFLLRIFLTKEENLNQVKEGLPALPIYAAESPNPSRGKETMVKQEAGLESIRSEIGAIERAARFEGHGKLAKSVHNELSKEMDLLCDLQVEVSLLEQNSGGSTACLGDSTEQTSQMGEELSSIMAVIEDEVRRQNRILEFYLSTLQDLRLRKESSLSISRDETTPLPAF